MIKIECVNGVIKVTSPYNNKFIKGARMIQGKWNSPCWCFPEENQLEVNNLILDVYGELPGSDIPLVTLEVDLDNFPHTDDIELGNVIIASRPGRDSQVVLSDNTMVISGSFYKSGGSAKRPCVTYEPGTIIKVKKFPEIIYEKIKDLKGVRVVSEIDKDSLELEKRRLLKRLNEINTLLNEDNK